MGSAKNYWSFEYQYCADHEQEVVSLKERSAKKRSAKLLGLDDWLEVLIRI